MKSNEQFSGVTKEVHYLGNLVLDNRMARAMSEGVSRYPIYRVVRFAGEADARVAGARKGRRPQALARGDLSGAALRGGPAAPGVFYIY